MTVIELIENLQRMRPDATVITFNAFGQRFEKAYEVTVLRSIPSWAAACPEIGPDGAVCIE